jgi:hypothetical protein
MLIDSFEATVIKLNELVTAVNAKVLNVDIASLNTQLANNETALNGKLDALNNTLTTINATVAANSGTKTGLFDTVSNSWKIPTQITVATAWSALTSKFLSPDQHGNLYGPVYRVYFNIAAGYAATTYNPLITGLTNPHMVSSWISQYYDNQFLWSDPGYNYAFLNQRTNVINFYAGTANGVRGWVDFSTS